jgi:L-lactate dehydrogenase complex protein LldG
MDIDLPTLLLRIRSGEIGNNNQNEFKPKPVGINPGISLGLKSFTWLTTKPVLYNLTVKIAGILTHLFSKENSWMKLPKITGWGLSKDFPKPAVRSFHNRWDERVNKKEKLRVPNHENKLDSVESKKESNTLRNNQSKTDRFKNEFIALNGHLVECEHGTLSTKVISLLEERKIKNIMAWEPSYLPLSLIRDLQDHGIAVNHGADPEVKVGITGITAAIAETGTIALTSGAGRPSSTSLLPETHIAILHQNDIYENLSQVFCLREIGEASSVNFISGPSRTADIEMTLTIGVHGPSEVYIYLIKD